MQDIYTMRSLPSLTDELYAKGYEFDFFQALKLLDAISSRFVYGIEGQFDAQMIQHERALVLERLGRPQEAIAALRALAIRYPVRASDMEPLALVDARQRLQRYDQGGRR